MSQKAEGGGWIALTNTADAGKCAGNQEGQIPKAGDQISIPGMAVCPKLHQTIETY